MRIKDLKKYARLKTGEIFETEKEMANLREGYELNRTELYTVSFMPEIGWFYQSIPVVATADTIEELKK